MASYSESAGFYSRLQDRTAPGLWQYQCNAAAQPLYLDDIKLADWKTRPNNSYYVIWNALNAQRNRFVSSDPSWASPDFYADNIQKVWNDVNQPRIFSVPFKGMYEISFKIAVAYHEELGTDGQVPPWFASFEPSPVKFGILVRRPGQPAFPPANQNNPDPLDEAISFQPNTVPPAVFDWSTVAAPDIPAQRVLAVSSCDTLPRTFTEANNVKTPNSKGMTQGMCTVTVGLDAGSQLLMCVSDYTHIGDAFNASYEQVTRTNFVPQLFDFRITYVNGDYKV